MNHQRKNFRNFLLYLFIIASILKPCLGSLEVINILETDHSLDDQEVQDNPESLQDDFTHCDFLSDSYDITRMLGYARLLRYTAEKNISNMKHPIAKNLCILFNFFSEPNNDTNKVQQTIKELYELLENEENRNCSYEEKDRIYFADILVKLRDSLSNPVGETAYENYMKCLFLRENFVLLRCSSWTNNNFACIESPGCIDIKMLLDHSPAHLNVFESEIEFDSLYPKYLYFSILEDEERRPRFISLKREYFYRFTDRNKICFYKLAGFLTKDFTGVSCYLKENGKWNKYISNQKVEERRLIRVPFAAVFERFAEYRRNPSERIKNR